MRKAFALTCLIAATLAACGKKADNAPAANAANAPVVIAAQPAPAAEPALPPVSPEACAILATYVKVELMGDFGLPVMVRVAPAKEGVAAAELARTFPTLKAAEAKALAEGLTHSIQDGSQLDCDWKALGLEAPRPVTPESNATFRLRPVAAGDVGLLETYTDAGTTALGGRCIYRKTGQAWARQICALTHLQ